MTIGALVAFAGRAVHRHLVAADRDRGVAGHDPLGVGLDRLAERLLDADRVAGEGGGATDLEHLAPGQTSRFRLGHDGLLGWLLQ
jgi:hypothetical protein